MENSQSTGTSKIDLPASDLLALYRLMALTREFEMRVAQIATQQSIVETPHLCVGEEAIGVGACYGLRRSTSRIRGWRERLIAGRCATMIFGVCMYGIV